jgi:hypothetical protein
MILFSCWHSIYYIVDQNHKNAKAITPKWVTALFVGGDIVRLKSRHRQCFYYGRLSNETSMSTCSSPRNTVNTTVSPGDLLLIK